MAARFDIEPLQTRTNLVLSVDGETLAQYRENERSVQLLAALRRKRVFGVDEARQQDAAVLTVRASSLIKYHDAPRLSVEVLNALYNLTKPDTTMSRMQMTHEQLDRAAGRYGMMVALKWPEAAPKDAARFATQHMQRFAQSVNLNKSKRMNTANDMVYVAANREQGITIETNPIGSCNISAGGYDYDPESEVVELWQHNIYNPTQQLACLMGAVCFATADCYRVDK